MLISVEVKNNTMPDVNASLITTGESPIKKPELKEKRYAKTKLPKTDRTLQ